MPKQIFPNSEVGDLAKQQVLSILEKAGFTSKSVDVVSVTSTSDDISGEEMDVEIVVNIQELSVIRTWKRDPPSPIGGDTE